MYILCMGTSMGLVWVPVWDGYQYGTGMGTSMGLVYGCTRLYVGGELVVCVVGRVRGVLKGL